MVVDPYFSSRPMTKATPRRRWRWLGRIVLFPLLILSGCHTLLTGLPIPLWHIERLRDPVAVTVIGDGALVLADGRRVRLPYITKLPQDDPAFAQALRHGVEVDDDGRVFGLIDPPRMCGNDPVVFTRQRIDLSELAGVLDPDGIDDSMESPEEIQNLKENSSSSRDRRGMPFDIMGRARRMRLIYESAEEGPERR
jgi:hypothetical protein